MHNVRLLKKLWPFFKKAQDHCFVQQLLPRNFTFPPFNILGWSPVSSNSSNSFVFRKILLMLSVYKVTFVIFDGNVRFSYSEGSPPATTAIILWRKEWHLDQKAQCYFYKWNVNKLIKWWKHSVLGQEKDSFQICENKQNKHHFHRTVQILLSTEMCLIWLTEPLTALLFKVFWLKPKIDLSPPFQPWQCASAPFPWNIY